MLMSINLIFLLLLFVFVDCSVEEVNRLRSEWRDKVREYQDIQNENKKIFNNLVVENAFRCKLAKINVFLQHILEGNDSRLHEESISFYREGRVKALKELEEIKKRAEKDFENKKKLLLRKEVDFEGLSNNELFIKFFDFILKNSLMAPVPKFPEIYSQGSSAAAADIKTIHMIRSKLIGLVKFNIECFTKIFMQTISQINEIKEEFKKFNLKEIIFDNFKMLKMRVMTMKLNDEEKRKKLLDYIEKYEKNQEEEMDWMEKRSINESVIKLKQYVDFLLSTNQWKLRVGHGIIDGDGGVDVDVKVTNGFLSNKITNTSRLAKNIQEKELEYIKSIKLNDSEKMKYAAAIGENKMYKFMLKKYGKMVEGMHKYLVKVDDKKGKSIYTEVIEDLV